MGLLKDVTDQRRYDTEARRGRPLTYPEIKDNPNHDEQGRFASGDGGTNESSTYKPSQSALDLRETYGAEPSGPAGHLKVDLDIADVSFVDSYVENLAAEFGVTSSLENSDGPGGSAVYRFHGRADLIDKLLAHYDG